MNKESIREVGRGRCRIDKSIDYLFAREEGGRRNEKSGRVFLYVYEMGGWV